MCPSHSPGQITILYNMIEDAFGLSKDVCMKKTSSWEKVVLWNNSSKKPKSEHKNSLIENKIGFVVIIIINSLGNGRLSWDQCSKISYYNNN